MEISFQEKLWNDEAGRKPIFFFSKSNEVTDIFVYSENYV